MRPIFFIFFIIPISAFPKPIEKKKWLENFTKSFLENFCASSQIQLCYEKILPSCREVVVDTIRTCTKETKIPAAIFLGPQSGDIGAELGRCVGRGIEKKIKKKNIETPQCQSL
ncbi:MAG: hypothetical protein JNL11_02730 [Bdellovibrionaceae bacterium]|nr:hypothetical protein [Pseudobdellovibrionaceae bacterium]